MTEVAVNKGAAVRKTYRGGSRSSLQPYQQLALMRQIAVNDKTMTALASDYGMTVQGIREFAKRHDNEITEIRDHMADQFAGLPLVRKENRLAEYEDAIMRLREHPNSDHHEWVKAEFQGLRNIAEELGQLPPRATVTVVPVIHVIEGVDVEDL